MDRQKRRHDVYGWYPANDGAAVLQVDPNADEATFPDQIGGVNVKLWKVAPPEPSDRGEVVGPRRSRGSGNLEDRKLERNAAIARSAKGSVEKN